MTNQQKIILAVGLIAFALIKVSLLMWWQNRQPPTQATSACEVAVTGCPFGEQGRLRLVGVGDNRTPFQIRAENVPANTQRITASFSMKNMDMGFNRFELIKQGDGVWVADKVHLPMCSQTRHDWFIEWTVDETQRFQASFTTK